ncbi:MAG: hypothetical protein PHV32_13420 [Eubacteriales bacterium]|nr:hypothetical protein [Eubacteriales bacterium]
MSDDMTLSFKGDINSDAIPMKLVTANIAGNGSIRALGGRYSGSNLNITRTSTGVYRIDHNLNTTYGIVAFDYTVFVMPTYSTIAVSIVPEIFENYIILRAFNSGGSAVNCDFHLRIEKI